MEKAQKASPLDCENVCFRLLWDLWKLGLIVVVSLSNNDYTMKSIRTENEKSTASRL